MPSDRPSPGDPGADGARGRGPGAGEVVAVAVSSGHTMSKPVVASIRLLAGLGVEGDAHLGTTVQHRSRVARDPTQPNLRQVHLVHAELHDRLVAEGYDVGPGVMGENVTTRGVDLLGLATGTCLRLGPDAEVEITGLRNPCIQLDRLQPGLKGALLDRDDDGELVRLAGVMAIVRTSGEVTVGDAITVTAPTRAPEPLRPV